MKSPKIKGIGEVATEYGAKVMKVIKKGLLGRSLFDFYGDVKANALRLKESSSAPLTPNDKDGGVVYVKNSDGKLYYKSNEVSEVELSSHTGLSTEEVQDVVGSMFTSNTETRIAATYQDGDGTIDLVVNDMTADTNTNIANTDLTATGSRTLNMDGDDFTITSASSIIFTTDSFELNSTGGIIDIKAGSETLDLRLYEDSDNGTNYIKLTLGALAANRTITFPDATGTVSLSDTVYTHPNHTGDVTSSGDGALTIADDVVTEDMLANTLLAEIDANTAKLTFPTGITYASEVLTVGNDDNGLATIERLTHSDSSGGSLSIKAGAGTGTDVSGGTLALYSGQSTGSSTSNEIRFYTYPAGSSGSSGNSQVKVATITHDSKLRLDGGVLQGPTNGDLLITSDGTMTFRIDEDNDETSQKFSFENNASTEIASLNDSGDLQIDGKLTVTGNVIEDNDGVDCITFDSSGNTTIANVLTVSGANNGILSLNSTSATGSPFIAFKQDGTRRSFIQHNDTDNNLRVVSEFGKVEISAASTNGVDSNVAYFEVQPTGIFKFGATDSDATLTTDGSMTFRIDTDNDSTSEKFSFQNNASTEIAWLDDGGNLYVSGDIKTDGRLYGPTDDDFEIKSDGNMSFFIDNDSDEASQKFSFNNHTSTEVASLSEAGALQINRALTYGNNQVKQNSVTVTLSTAQCNALNSTPILLVEAQGANTVIVPTGGMIRVDRASTQSNSSADMNFHYEGLEPGTYGQTSCMHMRRFMYNESGDRVFHILPNLQNEVAQNLTSDVDKNLEVSVDSALTNNCFTSITIYLTYNVFDIS